MFSLAQFAARHGLGGLLKDGYRTFTGIDEVTAKNIEACKTLTDITKTSLGGFLVELQPVFHGVLSLSTHQVQAFSWLHASAQRNSRLSCLRPIRLEQIDCKRVGKALCD